MKRILIVDDDAETLRLLSLRLRSHGYAVIEADSCEQALARIGAGLPDLIITGMRMGASAAWPGSTWCTPVIAACRSSC